MWFDFMVGNKGRILDRHLQALEEFINPTRNSKTKTSPRKDGFFLIPANCFLETLHALQRFQISDLKLSLCVKLNSPSLQMYKLHLIKCILHVILLFQ